MKFAISRGDDIDKIENLKEYLAEITKNNNKKGKNSKDVKEIRNITDWGF